MARWIAAAGSTVGLVRTENQDVSALSLDHNLMAVADGMGGMVDGAGAARLAINAVVQGYAGLGVAPRSDVLRRAFAEAHRAVSRTRNSGTTLLAAIADRDTVMVAHAGDCRAYLAEPGGGPLARLTADHTPRAGSNALMRYVGHPDGCTPDVGAFYVPRGSLLLLCSDGVWGPVPTAELAAILNPAAPASPAERVAAIVAAALREGAPDNATAVVGLRL